MSLSARELTQVHRRQQLALRRATVAEMARLWPALDWTALDRTYPRFAATVAQLVAQNRRTSAGLSAAYLRAFRVESGLGGDLRVITPDALPLEQFKTSLRVTSVVALKSAAAAGTPLDVAMGNALVTASGAMSRLVMNGGRETAILTGTSDSRTVGYRRVLGSGGCDWCRQYVDDEIHYVEGYDFPAHDHCGCSVEPVYD